MKPILSEKSLGQFSFPLVRPEHFAFRYASLRQRNNRKFCRDALRMELVVAKRHSWAEYLYISR